MFYNYAVEDYCLNSKNNTGRVAGVVILRPRRGLIWYGRVSRTIFRMGCWYTVNSCALWLSQERRSELTGLAAVRLLPICTASVIIAHSVPENCTKMAARIKRQNKAASADNVIWIDVTAATALIAIAPSVRPSVRPRPYVRPSGRGIWRRSRNPDVRRHHDEHVQQHTARSGDAQVGLFGSPTTYMIMFFFSLK